MIIILSFRISISKNKNADHRVKETCAIRSIQVTNENNHIFLLCDAPMSKALVFLFHVFYCNLKEKDHFRRITNSKKNKYLYVKSA